MDTVQGKAMLYTHCWHTSPLTDCCLHEI